MHGPASHCTSNNSSMRVFSLDAAVACKRPRGSASISPAASTSSSCTQRSARRRRKSMTSKSSTSVSAACTKASTRCSSRVTLTLQGKTAGPSKQDRMGWMRRSAHGKTPDRRAPSRAAGVWGGEGHCSGPGLQAARRPVHCRSLRRKRRRPRVVEFFRLPSARRTKPKRTRCSAVWPGESGHPKTSGPRTRGRIVHTARTAARPPWPPTAGRGRRPVTRSRAAGPPT